MFLLQSPHIRGRNSFKSYWVFDVFTIFESGEEALQHLFCTQYVKANFLGPPEVQTHVLLSLYCTEVDRYCKCSLKTQNICFKTDQFCEEFDAENDLQINCLHLKQLIVFPIIPGQFLLVPLLSLLVPLLLMLLPVLLVVPFLQLLPLTLLQMFPFLTRQINCRDRMPRLTS